MQPLIVGTMRLSAEITLDNRIQFIESCIDHGFTTFDHADIYGSYQNEALFGEALKKAPHLKAKSKHISKCGIQLISPQRPETWIKHYDLSAAHILKSAEQSLVHLGIEQLDVLLLHRPSPLMDVLEIASAFEHLKTSGKVASFGVSNFTLPQIDGLQSALPFPLVYNQIQGSLAHLQPLQDGTLEGLALRRIQPMFWSPLGGGQFNTLLTEVLNGLSLHYSCTPMQLALTWLLKLPSKPQLVLGSTNLERILSAKKALSIDIEVQHWFQLLRAATGHEVA